MRVLAISNPNSTSQSDALFRQVIPLLDVDPELGQPNANGEAKALDVTAAKLVGELFLTEQA